MTNKTTYDVVIIGAGTMGMAAGAFLAKQNAKTLLIDSFDPPHTNGSHHGDTRLIRHAYGEGRHYVTLVKRAQELWEDLERETGFRIFEKTGVIGLGPEESPFLRESIAAAVKYELPLDILTSQEIKNRWPGFSVPDHFIGCYEANSGIIYSENAIRAYRELATRYGADFAMNTPVQKISETDGNNIEITTAQTVFHAKKVIVTAGAWAKKLLPNLNLPIEPTRKAIAWFDAPEELYASPDFPGFFVEDYDKMFYGFPSIDGAGVKIGRSDGGQPIDPNEQIQNFGLYDSDEDDLRELLDLYMPSANGKLKQGKTCLYTVSEDHHFIIDHHPEDDRIIFACGFTGHGFKFGSVMGEVLSQMAMDGYSHWDITPFSLQRFR